MPEPLDEADTSADAAISRPAGGRAAAGPSGPLGPTDRASAKKAGRAGWLLATCAASLFAYGAGWGVAKLGLGARLLKVQAIEISGLGRTSREDVLQAAGLAMQQPILAIGLQDGAREVQALPWVRSAAIRRQLPFRVAVTVSEHSAKLAAMLSELWLVNEAGEPFKRFEAKDRLVLPMVTGLVAQPPNERPYAQQEELTGHLQEAIGLHEALVQIRDDLFAVEELHHDPDLGWSVVLLLGRAQGQVRGERAGVVVHLGPTPRERLGALVATLAELADRRATPTTIWAANAHQGGRIQVALADGLPPPPAKKKAAR